ncbi:bifunctional folylpolyglutamate synthase/dihydrofolate synthase [Helicobacter mesocricetorum]|uniref:bifunctional folylpolyglutamate synthase/dihydrofolate synthase n=1 Tax=Helicobacter mesocricetorum TaxID=87012 RepID=UPI001EFF4F29|nr:Mur ligase family protein [Helicobacter mesocricetorum]
MKIEDFLEQKGSEYAPFDPRRAPTILHSLPNLSNLKCKIIQVIGTNGKGSVGRFLSLLLRQRGFNVGHFSSPHLLHFNERFWLNGANVSLEDLNKAFLSLNPKSLQEASYFEVLTFLALEVFKECDYFVCEAGLGGEFDSTTTCTKPILTLFTSISFDHQEFLGESLEAIARTKLNAMDKRAILGIQSFSPVIKIAKEIAENKKTQLSILDSKDISEDIKKYCYNNAYPKYQQENLALAYYAFRDLGYEGDILNLPKLDLQGRMQQLFSNVWLDVVHNVGGAKAILENFSKDKYILVYNSYKDKNPKAILEVLKPITKSLEIFALNHPRMIAKGDLEQILKILGIPYKYFSTLNKNEKYLVCGSFSVVGEFLRKFKR